MLDRLLKFGVIFLTGAALAAPLAVPAQAAPAQAAQGQPAPALVATAVTAPSAGPVASARPAPKAPARVSGKAEPKPVVRLAKKAAPRAARDPQVYLFRGLANVFSLGMNDMSKELTAQGIPNKVLNHANWPRIAAEITAKYKADPRRTRPIVLIGHSLGANAVLVMSNQLARNGVPVDLVVTFDPTTKGPVAPGVRRYLNLYQSNNGWSEALDVPPGAGKRVVNSDVRKRADIKAQVSHFDIEKNRVLHQQVVSEIARLMGGRVKPRAKSGTM